jgi:hypothetical protein
MVHPVQSLQMLLTKHTPTRVHRTFKERLSGVIPTLRLIKNRQIGNTYKRYGILLAQHLFGGRLAALRQTSQRTVGDREKFGSAGWPVNIWVGERTS